MCKFKKKILLLLFSSLIFTYKSFAISDYNLQKIQKYSCIVCHSKIKVEFEKSIHLRAGIDCIACHGGNPNDLKHTAMSPSRGFKGRPDRSKISQLCADCHSNREMMRPYGIPVNQYEEYLTSQHGILYQSGDRKVAVCTDCHSKHKILPSSDTESSVYPANIPNTCGKCHSNKEYMKGYKIPTDQMDLYLKSVHGQSLILGGNKAAPNCVSCHGNHGALPPGIKNIGHICGKCHINTEDAFYNSPHRKAVEKGKMSPCTSCHSNHYIKHPTIDLVDTSCLQCHNKNSKEFLRGQEIKSLINNAINGVKKTEKLLKKAEEKGFEVGDLEGRLDEARTSLLQSAVIQHILSSREIEKLTVIPKSIAEDIALNIEDIEKKINTRKISLIFICLFILWMIILLYLKIRKAEIEQSSK